MESKTLDDGTITSAISILKSTKDDTKSLLVEKGIADESLNYKNLTAGLAAFKTPDGEDVEPLPFPVPSTTFPVGYNPDLISLLQQSCHELRKITATASLSKQILTRKLGNREINIGNKSAFHHQLPERLASVKTQQRGDAYPEDLLPIENQFVDLSVLLSIPDTEESFIADIQGGTWDVGESGIRQTFVPFKAKLQTTSGYGQQISVSDASGIYLGVNKRYGTKMDDGTLQVWLHITYLPETDNLPDDHEIVTNITMMDASLTSTKVLAVVQKFKNAQIYRNCFTGSTRYVELTASDHHNQALEGAGFTLYNEVEVLKTHGTIRFDQGFSARDCYRLRYVGDISISANNTAYAFYNCISLTRDNCKVTIDDDAFVSSSVFYNSSLDGEYVVNFPFTGFLNKTNIRKLTLNQGLAINRSSEFLEMSINMPLLESIDANGPLDFSMNDGEMFAGCMLIKQLPAIKAGTYNLNKMLENCFSLESIDFVGLIPKSATGTDVLKNCFSLWAATNVPLSFLTLRNGFDLSTCYDLERLTFVGGSVSNRPSLDVTKTSMTRDGLVECWSTLPTVSSGVFTIAQWQHDTLNDNDTEILSSKGWTLNINKKVEI